MAAVKGVSPGGALLRTSRMFSLPAPIPPPSRDVFANFNSTTSTLPFPTHQIITTTSASRQRGDWGLKRSLPLKATTKSTHAMLRVNQIDSMEKITDYSSASDHGITLRKFQELNLPVTVPAQMQHSGASRASRLNQPRRSVFEEDSDFTAVDPANRAAVAERRWKFTGPWLAGMTHGDFQKWLAKTVRPKRSKFREFLRQNLAAKMHAEATQVAMDAGEVPPALDASAISEDQLIEYLRKLRNNNQELYGMVGQFLDLAPLQPPSLADQRLRGSSPALLEKRAANPYSERGPPITHPSAGLSYLRTSAYLDNHPLYGPQRMHPPVEARVVKPRRPVQGMYAKIGVAGFIADAPSGDTASNYRVSVAAKQKNFVLDRLDPRIKGGAKFFVQPSEASVNSSGRVEILLDDADAEALIVAQELLGADESQTFGRPKPEAETSPAGSRADQIRRRYNNVPTMSGAQQYGLGSDTSFRSLL